MTPAQSHRRPSNQLPAAFTTSAVGIAANDDDSNGSYTGPKYDFRHNESAESARSDSAISTYSLAFKH